MTSTLRVTASNKFTLFDLNTRQIAVRNAFWKGSFVRIADIHFFSREGLLAYQEPNSSALFALIGLFKQSYNTHLRL